VVTCCRVPEGENNKVEWSRSVARWDPQDRSGTTLDWGTRNGGSGAEVSKKLQMLCYRRMCVWCFWIWMCLQ
jgi:hypothetical protein